MAPDLEPSIVLTPEHLMTFGGIIHGFARIENLMIATMSAIAEVDVVKFAIVMRELGYENKRDALYSYFSLFETKEPLQSTIRGFLDAAHEFAPMRNGIAHNIWIPGKRPNSIKPASLKVRGGKGKVVGLDENEKDYLLEELAMISDKLRVIYNSLMSHLAIQGLLSNIDENMLRTMPETPSSVGAQAK